MGLGWQTSLNSVNKSTALTDKSVPYTGEMIEISVIDKLATISEELV